MLHCQYLVWPEHVYKVGSTHGRLSVCLSESGRRWSYIHVPKKFSELCEGQTVHIESASEKIWRVRGERKAPKSEGLGSISEGCENLASVRMPTLPGGVWVRLIDVAGGEAFHFAWSR